MLAANMADDMLEKALIMRPLNALVAQLDRVLGYEPSGRRFESSRVRHKYKSPPTAVGFFYPGVAKNTLRLDTAAWLLPRNTQSHIPAKS